jgi:hypothetical protein
MMTRTLFLCLATASVALAESPVVPTNASTASKTISIQEMLVIGHSGMKLHSLAMITQGKVEGGIDESFMPGFKVCAEDPATPVRSVAARIMGQNLVAGLDEPNPEAVELLVKLAKDESSDVRFNAVYHGLTQLNTKSDEMVALLLDVAASNREHNLYDRIAESLEESQEQAIKILDQKMKADDSIATYEIYADMTGKQPPNNDKFLDMPSSRPKIFIFKGGTGDAEAYKAELSTELKTLGIENPELFISGVGANHVLLLKTYLTKDRLAVEKAFAKPGKFTLTQEMWLTPELEIQIDAMREKS